MPVVSQEGLVGRVAAVTAGAARVQLLTDPDVSITVHLKNANVEAILSGSLTGELTLNQIPQQALALAGEVLLTSGLGGNYPPNIPVGQITSVRQRPFDLFQSASVQAVTDFSQMEIVLVIINFRPIDISPLVPTPVP